MIFKAEFLKITCLCKKNYLGNPCVVEHRLGYLGAWIRKVRSSRSVWATHIVGFSFKKIVKATKAPELDLGKICYTM